MNDKLKLLKLKQKIKNLIVDLKGVQDISIEQDFENYNIIYSEILKTYKINDIGIIINQNFDENIIEIMRKNLSIDEFYYISFEGKYFLQFKFLNFESFIKSWREINKGYDLTFFNGKIIFVINYNEDNISIHFRKVDLNIKL